MNHGTSKALPRVAAFVVMVAVAITFTSPVFAGNRDFNGLVKSIEQQYGVRHTHIPMLGMLMFFAKPRGVHTLKIATFEGFHPKREVFGPDVQRMIQEHFGGEWTPFVRTWSRDGEATFIYANAASPQVELLIVALDASDASVVQVKVDPNKMDEWLDEPGHMASDVTGRHDEGKGDKEVAKQQTAAPVR